MSALEAHLATGHTTLCRCWAVERQDGVSFGFTDHDMALSFEGFDFRPETGMTARAVSQSTGLAVDNTEALGVLSDDAISETDIDAGRFDRADVRAWVVNWADVSQRMLLFRGTLGEITRGSGAFTAELRGLAEGLNQPRGRVFQKPCGAVLGDAACKVDLDAPGLSVNAVPLAVEGDQVFRFGGLEGYDERWFERGRLVATDGEADGLWGIIKHDRFEDNLRVVELWAPLGEALGGGVRLEAGCDKRAETCRLKFDNLLNFRGFPDIPGEDWLARVPRSSDQNDGGSLR